MTRKEARKAVASLLATIPTFVATYDREVPDFGRLSPVGLVHSDGTRAGPGRTLGQYQYEHALLISIWWHWGLATEDEIDDLSEAVWALLVANSGPTANWDSLEVDEQFSAMDYPVLDGVQYRREQVRVLIW